MPIKNRNKKLKKLNIPLSKSTIERIDSPLVNTPEFARCKLPEDYRFPSPTRFNGQNQSIHPSIDQEVISRYSDNSDFLNNYQVESEWAESSNLEKKVDSHTLNCKRNFDFNNTKNYNPQKRNSVKTAFSNNIMVKLNNHCVYLSQTNDDMETLIKLIDEYGRQAEFKLSSLKFSKSLKTSKSKYQSHYDNSIKFSKNSRNSVATINTLKSRYTSSKIFNTDELQSYGQQGSKISSKMGSSPQTNYGLYQNSQPVPKSGYYHQHKNSTTKKEPLKEDSSNHHHTKGKQKNRKDSSETGGGAYANYGQSIHVHSNPSVTITNNTYNINGGVNLTQHFLQNDTSTLSMDEEDEIPYRKNTPLGTHENKELIKNLKFQQKKQRLYQKSSKYIHKRSRKGADSEEDYYNRTLRTVDTIELGPDFIQFLKDQTRKAQGNEMQTIVMTKRQAKKIFQIIQNNRKELGLDSGRMELSIIEKQYSDIELKVNHIDDDFDFSKLSVKSKFKNSSSNQTKSKFLSDPNSQPAKIKNSQGAYQFPRNTRHQDFRMFQLERFKGRNSRKSSTHNEGSLKHDTITHNFEDFEEEIDAIMSGNGSTKGSRKNSKNSKKSLHQRSKTINVTLASCNNSEHKSSKFSKEKPSLNNIGSKKHTRFYKSGTSKFSPKKKQNKFHKKGHRRANTIYKVEGIKEVSEDEKSVQSDQESEAQDLHSNAPSAKVNYHSVMEEFTQKVKQKVRVRTFGIIKSMSILNDSAQNKY